MSSDNVNRLLETIQSETELYTFLVNILTEEQSVLTTRDARKIESLAAQKMAILEGIDKLAQSRAEVMRELGLADRAALVNWLADKPEWRDAWCLLETTVTRAQTLNHINGLLVAEHLSYVDEAIDLLMSSQASTLAYRRDGGTRSVLGGGRNLGEA